MFWYPVGTVDPDYVEFWRPWPRYYAYSMSADARHRRLAAALRQSGLQVVDLREVLDGARGTYRLTDGHWTDRGTQLSAGRIADALLSGPAATGRWAHAGPPPARPVNDAHEGPHPGLRLGLFEGASGERLPLPRQEFCRPSCRGLSAAPGSR